jgi:hypothetical protein
VIITASGPDRNSAGQSCGRDSRHAQANLEDKNGQDETGHINVTLRYSK